MYFFLNQYLVSEIFTLFEFKIDIHIFTYFLYNFCFVLVVQFLQFIFFSTCIANKDFILYFKEFSGL